MESLSRPCQNCHKPMNGGVYRAPHTCPHCLFEHEGGKTRTRGRRQTVAEATPLSTASEIGQQKLKEAAEKAPDQKKPAPTAPVNAVTLSSKPADEHNITEVLSEINAECVLNFKLTPDLISNGKFIGSKSEKVKAALDQGKKHVLTQLRQKAKGHGANMVTNVAVSSAVKKADQQTVSIIVRATGIASLAEVQAASEA